VLLAANAVSAAALAPRRLPRSEACGLPPLSAAAARL